MEATAASAGLFVRPDEEGDMETIEELDMVIGDLEVDSAHEVNGPWPTCAGMYCVPAP